VLTGCGRVGFDRATGGDAPSELDAAFGHDEDAEGIVDALALALIRWARTSIAIGMASAMIAIPSPTPRGSGSRCSRR
jgi:hypothetical protein